VLIGSPKSSCAKCGRQSREAATYCDACGALLAAPVAHAIEDATATAGPVFVGRQQDLALLRARLGKAVSGEGQVVAIAGEPGIGKTRIAQVLARDAAERAVVVLWGRCHEEPGSPPYWPWVQVLRDFVTGHDTEAVRAAFGPAASELTGIVPQLAERLPFIPVTPTPTDAAQARFRVFEAVLASLKRAANAEPLLLVLDNVHWADTTSLRLLEFLAPEISGTRLLVLITYRDIALSRRHPLSNSLAELARQPNFTRLRLRGLSVSETAQFVAAASGQAPPSDVLANVHSQTEGNPLFISEMTRYLVEEGVLGAGSAVASQAARAVGRGYRVPEGIKEAIGTRLNRLSASCNEVLAHAAVIGRVFRYDVLARLLDIDEREFGAALEEALAASVVEEMAEPGACQFSHALIRETLYDELPATRRARLHLRVGAVLEAMGSSAATLDFAALAHHYCAALPGGDTVKAVHYAECAAERANRLFAYEEAARYYRLAVQALEADATSDPRDRVRFLIGVGEAFTKSGNWPEAAEILQKAAGSAKSLGVAQELARAAMSFEEATWRPGLSGATAARLLRDALDALGEGESTTKAEVMSSLSRALVFSGEVDEGMRINAEAVAMARRLGNPLTLELALRSGLHARWLPERLEERMTAAVEAMRLARETGNRERELEAASWRLFDLMEIGNLQVRASVFETYAHDADELRQPFYQYIALSSRSMLALFEGRFDEAEQWAQKALAFGARMPSLDAAGIYGVHMFSIRREQGRLKQLAPLVIHFVRTTPQGSTWRPGLALIYAELGMIDDARQEFEVLAANQFAAVPRDGAWANCIAYLSEVCAFVGDAARAAELYAFLTPYDGRNIVAGPNIACSGAAARYLGMLAATMRRWDDAVRHFESALEMNARQGARPWLAHTRHQYARMLLARGLAEDRARAAALLDQALDAARALGMNGLAESAAALRETISGPPSREHYPAGLSRREVEVLRLIAAGKGNREIAERLFVSPNTVANHVRSILTKTNAANRTEAAAFALKNALVEE
jgi:DNA-binding CsgD family transcriptional regulator